jgi:presenilin-like A22 family membrane protease
VLSFILASLKLFRRNVITQNISELFIYGGLAAVFVPVLNMVSVSLFLIIISIYDFIAVYKTKHMVKLAKTHAKMKTFPGLIIPYGKKNKAAILGGGDLGLPLLFAGTALKTFGNIAYVIPLFTTAALYYLLTTGKKNKFYPAMPYLTVGCFLGLMAIIII